MKPQFLALASAFALTACGGGGTVDNSSTTVVTDANDAMANDGTANDAMMANDTAAAAPMAAQDFANTAAASDAFEIASAKLAETKAGEAGLKSFAKQMIKDHGESTAKLKVAAGAMTPDKTMNAEQKANMTALQSASGAEFDTVYKAQQLDAHQKALSAMQGYAASGDNAALKAFAAKTAPVVQGHLGMLQKM